MLFWANNTDRSAKMPDFINRHAKREKKPELSLEDQIHLALGPLARPSA